MTDKIVVLSTAATTEEAEKLARMLVERRLAACVNVIPGMKSYYRWQGELETAAECLLVVKSSRGLFPALTAALEAEHSYETPEAIAIPVLDGAANYLSWLGANLRDESAAE
jgi:periplasmic divalent cation tolerance protein